MYQFHELFAELHNKAVCKLHIVTLLFACRHVGNMKYPLMNEILSRQFITVCFLKFLKRLRAYREIIGSPVCEQISVPLIRTPDPDKIIEHGGKPHYRGRRMILA